MNFSKSKYCGLWQCPKIAWLRKYKPDEIKTNEELEDGCCDRCHGPVEKRLKLQCKNTKSITEKAGVCPDCGNQTQKMLSKNGKTFYGCSNLTEIVIPSVVTKIWEYTFSEWSESRECKMNCVKQE